jgi:general secretion pathway protein M
MKIVLSRTQSRLAALTVLLLAIVLVVTSVALPTLRLHRHYDDALDSLSDRLSRYQRVAAMRPVIEQTAKEVEKRDARKYYWKGNTPALVAAEMQSVVTRIVSDNNGKILSSQPLPVKDDGKPSAHPTTSLSVQMTASIVPLQLILHAIESHEPYLYVDQLSVRSNQGRTYKPVPGNQPEFVIQFTVHGYSMPGAPRT